MRHVRRDRKTLTGAHDLLAAAAHKPDYTALDHRNLLIDVAVLWDGTALAQFDPRDGYVLGVNHLAAEMRIHLLRVESLPSLMFHRGYFSRFRRIVRPSLLSGEERCQVRGLGGPSGFTHVNALDSLRVRPRAAPILFCALREEACEGTF